MKDPPRRNGELRPLDQRLIVGRLKEHGAANYQFKKHEAESYFVKLATPIGERLLWGKDLQRAIQGAETQPKLGDMVGVRRIGQEVVTVVRCQRDQFGRVVGQSEQFAHRSRWVVEKVQFFAERAKLARRVRDDQADRRRDLKGHPELKSTFLTLRGAEEVARRRITDPKDRERFLSLVKEAIVSSIKNGEAMPSVRLRQSTQAHTGDPQFPSLSAQTKVPT